jgi:radical SAM superfamily enzyme YgiQ (UPF0313 family)
VRVCLIQPPSGFLLDERVFVGLGLLKVASALEAAGHAVRVLDLSGVENYLYALRQYLQDSDDEAYGLTTTTPQLPAAARIAQEIRSLREGARIILGGPHVTLCYAARKLERKRGMIGRAARACAELEKRFDVLVAGDGEYSVLRAISQAPPPAFIDADDPKSGLFLTDAQFTASPLPARHLVDMSSYHYSIEGHEATSLIAQLGCPFSCGFCGGRNSKALRQIRTRTVESIVSEVEHLYTRYGYTGFMFYDDELNVNRSMCQLMRALSQTQEWHYVEFRLRGFVKAELFTDEQAQAMYDAGFRWLLCGFEAADPRILTNIRKRATLDDNTRAVEIAKRHGLKVKALMSVGHPGETPESIQAVRDWLVRVGVDDFDCTCITTYPGTPYYDEAMPASGMPGIYTYTQPQTGDKLYTHDVDYLTTADYYKGSPGEYRSFVFTDALRSDELVSMRDELERDVRAALRIPFNAGRPGVRYEASMGQLPGFILRSAEKP